MKECKICKEQKSLTEFNFANKKEQILMSYCKPCASKKSTTYFQRNPQKAKERDRRYYLRHTERRKNRVEKYRNSIPPAVYAFYEGNQLLYIGESGKPYARKTEHFTTSNISSPIARAIKNGTLRKENLDQVIIHIEHDDAKRYQVEQALINAFKPPLNTYGK